MKEIKLRDYQQEQFDFIKRNEKHKFPISIESPTGSGKSIVILEYVKYLFKTHPEDLTIVITTGFNNLVYSMAETAKELGLDPMIIVGIKHLACGLKKQPIDPSGRIQAFTNNEDLRCEHPQNILPNKKWIDKNGMEHIGGCNAKLWFDLKNDIYNSKHKLIITNHSSYLLYLNMRYKLFTPDICIVDESHTFSTFYDNYLKTEITKNEISQINKILNNKPQGMLFKDFIMKKQPIPSQLCKRISEIISSYDPEHKAIYTNLSNKIKEFDIKTKSIDNFFSISNNSMEKIRFWYDYEIEQNKIKYILFSATQDRFTRNMFGVRPEYHYKQKGLNIIDYSQSDCYIIKEKEFKDGLDKFIKICEEKGYKQGLILSTTMADVGYMQENGVGKYKVYTNIDEFKRAKGYKVLIGSRALFQGIDIPEIEFVGLNRIPFATYDDVFQARIKYLKDVAKIDPWNEYSIPEVINSIIQTTGRLWRKPGDKGTIGIFDPRLDGKFKYMMKAITETRRGIKINIISSDENIDENLLGDTGDQVEGDYYED